MKYLGTFTNNDDICTKKDLPTQASDIGAQEALVSGTNIKTINNQSILGSGDLSITASAAWGSITGTLSSQTDLQNALDAKPTYIEESSVASVTLPYYTKAESDTKTFARVYSSISEISESLSILSTMTDVMTAMADNSILMADISGYPNLRPLSGTFGQGILEIKKLSANNCVARYTALANPSAALSECRMWYGEFGNSTGYEWRGWNEVSTKSYVDSAIASAITTTLNTEV